MLSIKVLDNEMGDGCFHLFFVYDPSFIYLCIISHQCNASESNFKENLGIQDILGHQKALNLVNSLFLANATSFMCGTIWCHYNGDLISSDLIGQKFLNYWQIGTVNRRSHVLIKNKRLNCVSMAWAAFKILRLAFRLCSGAFKTIACFLHHGNWKVCVQLQFRFIWLSLPEKINNNWELWILTLTCSG